MEEIVVDNTKELNGVELGKALSALYDVECQNYQTTRLIEGIDEEISRLAIPKKLVNEAKPEYCGPKEPELSDFFNKKMQGDAAGVSVLTFFGIVLFGDVERRFLCAFLVAPLFGVLFSFLLAALKYFFAYRGYEKNNAREYEKWVARNNAATERYQAALDKESQRMTAEISVREALMGQRNELSSHLRDSKERLNVMYGSVGIGGDYRRLIPMRYMANFYELGISRKLEGTDGLYYLVRQELRADQFTANLAEISNHLQKLISSQTEIYHEICDMNRNVQSLLDDLIYETKAAASAAASAAETISKSIKENANTVKSSASYIAGQIESQNSYLNYLAYQRL